MNSSSSSRFASPPVVTRGRLTPFTTPPTAPTASLTSTPPQQIQQKPQSGHLRSSPTSNGQQAAAVDAVRLHAVVRDLEGAVAHERRLRIEAQQTLHQLETACNATVSELNAKLTDVARENATLRALLRESRFQREVDGLRCALAEESTERRRACERLASAIDEHAVAIRILQQQEHSGQELLEETEEVRMSAIAAAHVPASPVLPVTAPATQRHLSPASSPPHHRDDDGAGPLEPLPQAAFDDQQPADVTFPDPESLQFPTEPT
jgi:hypothetical protein